MVLGSESVSAPLRLGFFLCRDGLEVYAFELAIDDPSNVALYVAANALRTSGPRTVSGTPPNNRGVRLFAFVEVSDRSKLGHRLRRSSRPGLV